ncbi:MAG: hypothetical protein IT441_06095 [Phycisphaeraceae bacterium]|nr:hypothetical protein [Phycisphaeraceae bacterium]
MENSLETQWANLVQMQSQISTAAAAVTAGTLLVLGIMLWALGGRMARPCGAMLGLLAGLAVAYLGMPSGEGRDAMVVSLVAGTLIGGVLAWLLFRVWMAVVVAVLLSIAGPTVMLTLQGSAPPGPPAVPTVTPLDRATGLETLGTDQAATTQSAWPDVAVWRDRTVERAQQWWRQWTGEIQTWWAGLGTTTKLSVWALALIGAGAGVLLGLIFPQRAAAAAAALIGATMMVFSAAQFDRLGYLGKGADSGVNFAVWLEDPRQAAAAVGLITALGIVLQWTVFRAKTDRK